MKKLMLAVIMLAGLSACTNEGDKVEALQAEVLELHDSTMVKMDAIYVLIDELKEMKETLEMDSANPQPAVIVQVLDGITQLRKADDAMMDWMRDFEPVEKDAPVEESLNYLEKQQKSIKEVDLMIDNSLKNGQAILNGKQ